MVNLGTLRTKGRRTGLVRAVELRYSPGGGGSFLIRPGGYAEQWPLNLLANPECAFVIDGKVIECRALPTGDGAFRLVPERRNTSSA
jgi:hypothetical protein